MARQKSTWIANGDEVSLVNHRGRVLARLPQRFTAPGEAEAEAARRNEKANR